MLTNVAASAIALLGWLTVSWLLVLQRNAQLQPVAQVLHPSQPR
jgi:hypothetical protein